MCFPPSIASLVWSHAAIARSAQHTKILLGHPAWGPAWRVGQTELYSPQRPFSSALSVPTEARSVDEDACQPFRFCQLVFAIPSMASSPSFVTRLHSVNAAFHRACRLCRFVSTCMTCKIFPQSVLRPLGASPARFFGRCKPKKNPTKKITMRNSGKRKAEVRLYCDHTIC